MQHRCILWAKECFTLLSFFWEGKCHFQMNHLRILYLTKCVHHFCTTENPSHTHTNHYILRLILSKVKVGQRLIFLFRMLHYLQGNRIFWVYAFVSNLEIWQNCNGGKKCAQYLHCLHHFLESYPIGAGHLTISHDRGGHLYNEMACRYYQLITSPSSPKGQRLFYNIQVIIYTTSHSGNGPDRKSAHFDASFKRRLRRYFTLPERVSFLE